MKKLIIVLFFLPLMLSAQETSMNELLKGFEEPGNAWRGKPFWSWNGELEQDELIRQIHVMKEMGMGGFFMHSRTGLKTEYLGDKWFDLINACADEAEKLGMEAWLYDEDRWPSGLAGGLVTKYPEYRARLLIMQPVKPAEFKPDQGYLALFSCRLDDLDCYDVQRITEKDVKKLDADRTVLAFSVHEKPRSTFFNGYTDVDRLSREATDYFIKVTHDEYKKHCGDRLGNSIYGIFTDEPHRQGVMNSSVGNFVPWTGKFADEFKQRMGYDIMEKLPEIFYRPSGKSVSKVKWDYMETVQQLFIDNWIKPYYDWCEENNIIFTGHFLHENQLTSQAAVHGSLMRGYEHMHYPGVDVLQENNRNFWIGKQVQSVARQMGQPFILSELYGVTGWQFDFADHKYVGDWQALFGINLRCHHLSWYTMEGQAKRDYPASILHQSPWYKDYNYVETYYARLGYLLGQGQADCNVLVVNPIESVWSQIRIGWASRLSPAAPEIVELEDYYSRMFHALQGNQIDFDYGDEGILINHASIGTDQGGGPVLQVGKANYTTVVLGGMTTIRSSTMKLLEEFARAGGKIILAGDAPTHVDAFPSESALALKDIAKVIPFDEETIARTVRENVKIPVEAIDVTSGKNIDNIFCQVLRDGNRTILVAMNVSREDTYENVRLRIAGRGEVSEWDCESGEIYEIRANSDGGFIEIPASFTGIEEHVYTITPESIPGAKKKVSRELLAEVPVSGPYTYSLDEPNLCVLDIGFVEIDGAAPSGLMEILKIDEHIRDHYDLPYRAGNMIQPWFKKKFSDPPEVKGTVKIHYPFYIEKLPDSGMEFCMETPHEFRITVNGKAVTLEETGWWVDKAIRKFSLPVSQLRQGENILVQEFFFRDDLDIEAMYLLGNFSVRLEGNRKILDELPGKISTGDLTGQGFPFYTGKVRYQIPVTDDYSDAGEILLEVPAYEAACIKVDPDGPDPGMIAWQPNRVEVTDLLEGAGELTLEVTLTRRNAFGPLHHTPFTSTTGPGHFLSKGNMFTMNYMLYPGGIMENPRLLIYK